MKSLFAVLLFLVGTMAAHYILSDRPMQHDAIASMVQVTGISQPSLGVAWYAPRMVTEAATAVNPAYPEFDSIRRSDYVYAQ
jgi:hypothetical protein